MASSSSASISFFFLMSSFSASSVYASVAILNSIFSFLRLKYPMFLVFFLLISESFFVASCSASLYESLLLYLFIFSMIPIRFFFCSSMSLAICCDSVRGFSGLASLASSLEALCVGFSSDCCLDSVAAAGSIAFFGSSFSTLVSFSSSKSPIF